MTMHSGSCHCGAVRYEADVDLSQPVISCNCSMCKRKGTLLTFVPEEKFKLLSGKEKLTDYQFNKKHIHHNFCSVCGVTSFARGKNPKTGADMIAVNARCLEGVDVDALSTKKVDGASF